MHNLNLKRFIIVNISDENNYSLQKHRDIIDDKTYTITIIHLHTTLFFSLKSFNFFFNQEKNKNYEKNLKFIIILSY